MRAVVQRVTNARVTVAGQEVGAIGQGLLVLVGVERGDGLADVAYVADKVRHLRVFEDAGDQQGRSRMTCSVADIDGDVLVVSQFTLAADVRKGRRPSFDQAAPPEIARALYEAVVRELRSTGLRVETGEFQANMHVGLVNDGPVTVLVDSRRRL